MMIDQKQRRVRAESTADITLYMIAGAIGLIVLSALLRRIGLPEIFHVFVPLGIGTLCIPGAVAIWIHGPEWEQLGFWEVLKKYADDLFMPSLYCLGGMYVIVIFLGAPLSQEGQEAFAVGVIAAGCACILPVYYKLK